MRYKFLIEFDQTLTVMPNIPNGQQGNEKEKKNIQKYKYLANKKSFRGKVMETTNLNLIK